VDLGENLHYSVIISFLLLLLIVFPVLNLIILAGTSVINTIRVGCSVMCYIHDSEY